MNAEKPGYKVVWCPARLPGQMFSLRELHGAPGTRGVVTYRPRQPATPPPGAGPLTVLTSLEVARRLAKEVDACYGSFGEAQIWRVAWKPWQRRLPRLRGIAFAAWSCAKALWRGWGVQMKDLARSTRLARQVVLVERVY